MPCCLLSVRSNTLLVLLNCCWYFNLRDRHIPVLHRKPPTPNILLIYHPILRKIRGRYYFRMLQKPRTVTFRRSENANTANKNFWWHLTLWSLSSWIKHEKHAHGGTMESFVKFGTLNGVLKGVLWVMCKQGVKFWGRVVEFRGGKVFCDGDKWVSTEFVERGLV